MEKKEVVFPNSLGTPWGNVQKSSEKSGFSGQDMDIYAVYMCTLYIYLYIHTLHIYIYILYMYYIYIYVHMKKMMRGPLLVDYYLINFDDCYIFQKLTIGFHSLMTRGLDALRTTIHNLPPLTAIIIDHHHHPSPEGLFHHRETINMMV